MARPRKFEEDAAVASAQAAFRRGGYAGTSLSDLAEATGLGKGSLYNTFGDKRQIFERAFVDYCDKADAAVDGAFEGSGGVAAALGYLRQTTEDTLADTEHVGCMIAKATAELAVGDSAVVDRASKTLGRIEDHLTTALTQARAGGEISAEVQPRDLARLLLAVSRGVEALGKTGYPAESLASISETVARLLTPDSGVAQDAASAAASS